MTIQPDFREPKIRVGFPLPPNQEDAKYIHTILASTPGCAEVVHHDGDCSFWVKLDSDGNAAKVAAQCLIEQAFLVPHIFACKWFIANFKWDQGADTGYALWGFLFLEPVATSLASTLMAQLTALSVRFETLLLDNHMFVVQCDFSLPTAFTYMGALTGTQIRVDGIDNIGPWDGKWGLQEFLKRIRNPPH